MLVPRKAFAFKKREKKESGTKSAGAGVNSEEASQSTGAPRQEGRQASRHGCVTDDTMLQRVGAIDRRTPHKKKFVHTLVVQ